MRTWIGIIIGLICYLPAQANGPVQSNFFKGSIEESRSKASQEGKLFLLDYYADWCTPCNWMKETTYTDAVVIEILDKDYVAIKINIDDLEGFDLKERYQVKYLPTILIFNSQSQLLLRIEETLSPSQMTQALKKYNVQEHKIAIRHEVNISPQDQSVSLQDQLVESTDTSSTTKLEAQSPPAEKPDKSLTEIKADTENNDLVTEEKTLEKTSLKDTEEDPTETTEKDVETEITNTEQPAVASEHLTKNQNAEPSDTQAAIEAKSEIENEIKNEVEVKKEVEVIITEETTKVESPIEDSAEKPSKELPQEKISMRIERDPDLENELGNFKYTKKVTQKYRLQVGVYSKFKNTYEIVNDLKSKFAEPVIVLNDSIDGKVMYRIFLGEFYEIGEAESFQKMIKHKYNLQSVIK